MAGVSRTVVREAVATLRAEGLVITRQGVGAFLAEKPPRRLFRLDSGETRSSADVLDTMALRAAVEAEAAGLAVQRPAPAGLDAIRAACAAILAAIEGRSATKARAAMREHLMHSRERYRDLTAESA